MEFKASDSEVSRELLGTLDACNNRTWKNAMWKCSNSEQKIIEKVVQDLTQAQREGQLEEWIRTSVHQGVC